MAEWFLQDLSPRALVDRELRVLSLNDACEDMLERLPALRLQDGFLTCASKVGTRALRSFVEKLELGPPQATVINAAAHTHIAIQAKRLERAGAGAVALRLREARLEIYMPDLGALGLTPAEHQVVLQTVAGDGPDEIGRKTCRSVYTVRTHLKRAYTKLGVGTREQLFAKLLTYAFLG